MSKLFLVITLNDLISPSKLWIECVWFIVIPVIQSFPPNRNLDVRITLKKSRTHIVWSFSYSHVRFRKDLVTFDKKTHTYHAICVFRLQVDAAHHINPDQELLWSSLRKLPELLRWRWYVWVVRQRVNLERALNDTKTTSSNPKIKLNLITSQSV